MAGTPGSSGQTDVDRLFYFVAAIVAFLIVVPTTLGVAGLDVRDGSLLGGNGPESGPEGVQILAAYGTGVDDNATSVSVVEVVVANGGGSTIDLSEATVTWDGGQVYELTPRGVDAGHASFDVTGDVVLAEPTDRAILRFDLGSEDIAGVDRFGERLAPGQTVTLSIMTDDGVRTNRELVVPDPLPGGSGVAL
jgi:archaellin